MFCASLRRRPSYASVLPALSKDPELALRENQLRTHDLAVTLDAVVDPKTGCTISSRCIKVLLFSPGSTSDTRIGDTIERVQNLVSLAEDEPIAIVYLLSPPPETSFISARQLSGAFRSHESGTRGAEGMQGYAKLQAKLAEELVLLSVSILPLPRLERLVDTLKKYAITLRQPKLSDDMKSTHPLELLNLCTSNPRGMSQDATYMLSDLFPHLQALSQTFSAAQSLGSFHTFDQAIDASSQTNLTRDWTQGPKNEGHGKLRQLRDLFGDQEATKIAEFWKA